MQRGGGSYISESGKAVTPGDEITAYKYLQGNNIIEGKGLFIVSEDDMTGSNGLKQWKKKFR